MEGDSRPVTTLKKQFFLTCCLLAAGAQASVILTNGSPNTVTGDLMTGYIEANSFSLTSPATITGVNFEAFIQQPETFQSTVTYYLYADNSGSPGNELVVGNASVTTTDLGPSLFSSSYEAFGIDFSLNTPFSASAGTTYWLGLYDGTLFSGNDNTYWAVSTGGQGVAMFLVSPYNGSWDPTAQAPFYFQLTSGASSSAPEPGSTALVSAGLAMLAVGLGRRRG